MATKKPASKKLASKKPASKSRATKKSASKKSAAPRATKGATIAVRVQVRTPNVPGYTGSVDKEKYDAMKVVLLRVFAKDAALTQSEMWEAARKIAPQTLWPGGAKIEWWAKNVQLDLEAQGVLKRDGGKPLRWSRA